jgi:hypothetical protein
MQLLGFDTIFEASYNTNHKTIFDQVAFSPRKSRTFVAGWERRKGEAG